MHGFIDIIEKLGLVNPWGDLGLALWCEVTIFRKVHTEGKFALGE